MIVRTYGRRNRGIDGNYSGNGYDDDDVSDSFKDSLSQESPQDIYSFAFSSQDSSHWSFDSDPFVSNSSQESRQLPPILPPPRRPVCRGNSENVEAGFRKSKKPRIGKKEIEGSKKLKNPARSVSLVTLMETQEFGEMMEHMDEVNFALDGLRKGQPARIRRTSLLSLLSICGTAQQRRLLRVHGMAKTIIDAVLGLSFDDSPSNLAAAALFYVLTSDSQDDHLMDSPSCIRFLIKLLKPLTRDGSKDKEPSIGCKLLALRKDADILQDTAKGVDSTSAAIMLKVEEILVSCKEIKSRDDNNNTGTRKLELSPKWISLLTMEKACISTIAIEDTSGTVRRTGGNFKENLRELGGLDAVFEVARNCHAIMEGWLEQSSASTQESKDNSNLESLILLLKCLKILENATFLSKDNQCHLLEMKGSFESQGSPRSFTKLVISVIKILSGLSLVKSFPSKSNKEGLYNLVNGTGHTSETTSLANHKVHGNEIITIGSSLSSTKWTSSQKSLTFSEDSQWLSETATTSLIDNCLLKMRVNSSTSGSSTGTSRGSNSGLPASNNGIKMNLGLGNRPKATENTKFDLLEDSQDPFAFDEDDFEPSKWDLMSGREMVVQTQKSRATSRKQDNYESMLMLSQQESSNVENHQSQDVSCSSAVDEEKSNLLAECLLTSVKVLMNLTNDNPMGCQQIAKFGGLETLSSLIAVHFPSFSSPLPPFNEIRENTQSLNSSVEVDNKDRNLTDQELDFLVAILGLLVNLVEKDSRNRSHLASTSVPLHGLGGSAEESCRDVIPLLCSIFLANQGAGEAAGEEKALTWDDEEAVLQGEKEAEKMIVEAYAALLLAFLSTESPSIRKDIAECLPDHKLAILVPVLERFVEFHLTLNMISPETHSTVLEVIESCRVP